MHHNYWWMRTIGARRLPISKTKVFGFDVLDWFIHVEFITDAEDLVRLGMGQISRSKTTIVPSRTLYIKSFCNGNPRSERHVCRTGIMEIVPQDIVVVVQARCIANPNVSIGIRTNMKVCDH